jgi:hypothetical protein
LPCLDPPPFLLCCVVVPASCPPFLLFLLLSAMILVATSSKDDSDEAEEVDKDELDDAILVKKCAYEYAALKIMPRTTSTAEVYRGMILREPFYRTFLQKKCMR